jgi:hypothetical protein
MFPVIDPLLGIQLTPDGRDIVAIWPTPDKIQEYELAVVRTTLWQFRNAWKYDTKRGIEYLEKVLGHSSDIRVLQEIFRLALTRYLTLTELRVWQEDSTIYIFFRSTRGTVAKFDLMALPPDSSLPSVGALIPLSWESTATLLRVKLSGLLDPAADPDPEDFTFDVPILDAWASGDTLYLLTDELPLTGTLKYISDSLVGALGESVPYFQIEFTLEIPEDALLTEDGDPILTEDGEYILIES